MVALMLDPIFKSLILISSFIHHEHGVAVAEKYDKKSIFPMLLKS